MTMTINRTAAKTRTQQAALFAVLGLALTAGMTACSPSNANESGNTDAGRDLTGTWIVLEGSWEGNILAVDGDQLTYVRPLSPTGANGSCDSTELLLDDIEVDTINLENVSSNSGSNPYQVISTGKLEESRLSIWWDDADGGFASLPAKPGSGDVIVSAGTIAIDEVFRGGDDWITFYPIEDERAQALLEKICGQ